jgi:hypothetical protein
LLFYSAILVCPNEEDNYKKDKCYERSNDSKPLLQSSTRVLSEKVIRSQQRTIKRLEMHYQG